MIKSTDILHAQWLKSLRVISGKKQFAVASDLGLRQQQYSDLENGKTPFTENLIRKICEVFHVQDSVHAHEESFESKEQGSTIKHSQIERSGLRSDPNQSLSIYMYKKMLIEMELEKTKLKIQLLDAQTKLINTHLELKNHIYVLI